MNCSFLLISSILTLGACGPANSHDTSPDPSGTGGATSRDHSQGNCVTCAGQLQCSSWTVGDSCDWQSCYCFGTETTAPAYFYFSSDGQCTKCTEGGAACEKSSQALVNHCGQADGASTIVPDETGDTGLGACGTCPSGKEQCTDWIMGDLCGMKACSCIVTVKGVESIKTYYYADARGDNFCYQCDTASLDCQNEARGVMLALCSSKDHTND